MQVSKYCSYTAVRRVILQYAELYCRTQSYTAVRRVVLQYAELYCSTQSCTAVHRVILQYVDLYCSMYSQYCSISTAVLVLVAPAAAAPLHILINASGFDIWPWQYSLGGSYAGRPPSPNILSQSESRPTGWRVGGGRRARCCCLTLLPALRPPPGLQTLRASSLQSTVCFPPSWCVCAPGAARPARRLHAPPRKSFKTCWCNEQQLQQLHQR